MSPSSIRARHSQAMFAATLSVLIWVISSVACADNALSVQALRFIGEQQIPHKQTFEQTTVGGLSGIDYDARTDTWILASDDRSDFDASRFYTATLTYDEHAFALAPLTTATFFEQHNGDRNNVV